MKLDPITPTPVSNGPATKCKRQNFKTSGKQYMELSLLSWGKEGFLK